MLYYFTLIFLDTLTVPYLTVIFPVPFFFFALSLIRIFFFLTILKSFLPILLSDHLTLPSLGADTLSFIVMLLPLLTDDFPLSLTIGADDAAFCEGFVTVTFTSGTAGVSEGV